MTKLRYIGVGLAAALLAVLAVLVPGQSNATTLALTGGPGTTQQPGPYYNGGDLVGICVATGPGGVTYVEIHTNFGTASSPNPNALGNCLRGDTQLVVEAVVPGFDVGLTPAPTSSPSAGL